MAKNKAIGEVNCPHKGCPKVCNIYRFQGRATEAKLARFAGKLYADCPDHGRIGADGKQATQDYILNEGKIWGPSESAQVGGGEKHQAKAPEPAAAAKSPPEQTRQPPAKAPEKAPPKAPLSQPRRRWFSPLI